MKISPNMKWAEPYLTSVSHLVPVNKITRVRGYYLPVEKFPTTEARIWMYEDGRITLSILLSGYQKTRNGKARMTMPFEVVLLSLAHELAHIKHWEHTPNHTILMAQIFSRFALVAKQQGVKDTSRRIRKEAA